MAAGLVPGDTYLVYRHLKAQVYLEGGVRRVSQPGPSMSPHDQPENE
jgi:hypothetical protein